jgi:alpha-galactosidase
LHSWGLKFGIFSAAGTKSCESGAGSLTYEQYDAADFASWGVDYLKYGDCNGLGIPKSSRFASMRDALNKTGRPVYYSLSKGDQSDIALSG